MNQPYASHVDQVLRTATARQDANLADLFRLLRQPSISTQGIGVAETATIELELLRQAGLEARLIESTGYPVVYGEWLGAPGQPTILFYGHYDVQPADPLELWTSDPFEPTLRGGRIYCRGVADNKAQHFSHFAAIRSWMEATGRLPVNVKVILEGEEEIGSPHLDAFVREHRDLLACDLVYTSDGPVTNTTWPEIAFGVRGLLYIELRATGASRDLHSGHWGGVAPNPILALARLLTTMIDDDNTITIDGFHDDIVEPIPAARAAMDRLPFPIVESLAGIGLTAMVPPADLPYADRIMARPTLNVAGIGGGYQGPGSKTVLPHTASMKIDMRLVPNQHPDRIWAKVQAHVAQHAPEIEVVKMEGAMLPSFTPVDTPASAPIRRAVAAGFGTEPIDIPLVGGSLPDATWTQTLGVPSFLVPYGAPEQANHAPNESYRLERLWQGIATSIHLLHELSVGE